MQMRTLNVVFMLEKTLVHIDETSGEYSISHLVGFYTADGRMGWTIRSKKWCGYNCLVWGEKFSVEGFDEIRN